MMNEISWPIDRKNIYLGKIASTDGNRFLKERSIIFTSNESLFHNICNLRLEKFNYLDLNYESPHYQFELLKNPLSSSSKPYKKLHAGFKPCSIHDLNYLLDYFGFNSKLYLNDYMDMLTTLFNGKFPYENCECFGYQKKSYMMWQNGVLVLNPEMQKLSDYDMRRYELINEKIKLARFFPLLCEVDYKNPEAIFKPLEEEGPIRKRILTGDDRNE